MLLSFKQTWYPPFLVELKKNYQDSQYCCQEYSCVDDVDEDLASSASAWSTSLLIHFLPTHGLTTALPCTALHCSAVQCTALHCTALYCTALHCTALPCTAAASSRHFLRQQWSVLLCNPICGCRWRKRTGERDHWVLWLFGRHWQWQPLFVAVRGDILPVCWCIAIQEEECWGHKGSLQGQTLQGNIRCQLYVLLLL